MQEKVTKGKVVHKKGKYFLDVAGKMQEMPVGLLADEKFLKEQVGQEVEVLYSTPMSFVAGLKFRGRPGLVCNIPPLVDFGNIIAQPSAKLTRSVATKLLKEGFITQEVFNKITAE